MEFTVTSCQITGGFNKTMTVEIDLSIAELIEQVGQDELLNEITEKAAIDHFGIDVAE